MPTKCIHFSVVLLALTAACAPPTSSGGDQPSRTPAPTDYPPPTPLVIEIEPQPRNPPTPPSSSSVNEPPTPEAPLSPNGPWSIVNALDGLWAFNLDGTGLTRLTESPVIQRSLSPDMRSIAYVIDSFPDDDLAGLELRILTLPGGDDRLLSSLQNPTFVPDLDADPIVDPWEAMIATVWGPPSWSPDGSSLAFVGQSQGPSADVYVFSLVTGTARRLTSGHTQAYQPSWSPDGRYLFHSGVRSFGTGAGYSGQGSWLMRSDGSQFQDISAGYGSDYLLHWPTPHTLLLASGRQPCGAGHLRTYDIDTSTTYEFWPYFFNDFVVDPSSGQVLIAIPADFADCDIDPQPTGLFSFSPPDYTPESLSPNSFERLELDPSLSGAYLLLGDGHHLHRISPDRQVTPLPDSPPGFPMPSPAGNLWLWDSLSWNDPGIWVGKSGDLTPTRVSTSHAYDLAWFPSGAGFIYIDLDDDAVYIATAPSFEPALLSRGPQLGIDAELDIAAPAH